MRERLVCSTFLLLISLSPLFSAAAQGQTRQSASDSELFRTIASLDAAVFAAYNACDLEKFGSFFSEDVEFYHDRGGVTLGRQDLVASIKYNICGKVRREPIAGTFEVHPMNGYGALQIGAHRFCDSHQKACDPANSGVAKFIHLWQSKDGTWKVTRVLSFDHVDSK